MSIRACFLIVVVALGALVFEGEGAAGEPPSPAPREVFKARRAALGESLGDRKVRFHAGEAPKGEHDVDFRVASDFFYLSGIEEPGAVIEVGGGADVLFLPPRNPMAERWEGPRLHAGSPAARDLGFVEVRPLPGGPRPEPDDVARERVAALRLVKDEHEIAALRRAIDITTLALAEAARSIEPGIGEWEIDALIRYVFRREGAERAGFPSIVGSGPNSCILHYSKSSRRTEAGDLVVCDVGAEYGRYSADVTRTFPVSGRFTPEQRRVYDAVLRAQEAGIAAVRPGARVRDVHRAAAAELEKAGLARYFFHGTSHWLGLNVHDVGDYDTPLAPGMVLTVEPGAYIAAEEIGIRIEDDVLVVESGRVLLSGAVPRAPEAIEALMRERGLGNAPLGGVPAPARPPADASGPAVPPAPQPGREF